MLGDMLGGGGGGGDVRMTNPLQGSTLRKNFISPAGLVTETFTSPEIFLLALISMITLFK